MSLEPAIQPETAPNDDSAAARPYRGGPRTPEGRARAAFNALKHGLTGRTVVLPAEDMSAYRQFSQELVESFDPKTPFERQLAQTIADTQWRLNRARSIEDSMLCMGSNVPESAVDADNPQVYSALEQAKAFKEDSKAFANLTLYEQRLHRQQKQAFDQLQQLQSQRKAEEQACMEQAKLIHKLHKMKGEPRDIQIGPFVFSTARIDLEIARHRRLYEAQLARDLRYNCREFEAKVAKMAA